MVARQPPHTRATTDPGLDKRTTVLYNATMSATASGPCGPSPHPIAFGRASTCPERSRRVKRASPILGPRGTRAPENPIRSYSNRVTIGRGSTCPERSRRVERPSSSKILGALPRADPEHTERRAHPDAIGRASVRARGLPAPIAHPAPRRRRDKRASPIPIPLGIGTRRRECRCHTGRAGSFRITIVVRAAGMSKEPISSRAWPLTPTPTGSLPPSILRQTPLSRGESDCSSLNFRCTRTTSPLHLNI
jgi:hypothetical protein